MNTIMKTEKDKTFMSVEKGKVTLLIGTDLDSEKSKPFLEIIDDVLENTPINEKPFYGHFSFSKDKVEITLSHREEGPLTSDLTYKRKL